MIIATTKKTRPAGFPERMDAADFIGQMCQHFRVYHKEGSPEEAQWTDGMIAVLSVYPEDVLADGCLWFFQHRKEVRFPLPAEIITVCDEIAKERARPTLLAAERDSAASYPYSRERSELVGHLLRAGPMGSTAVREGWIGMLGDYVRRHGRLPDAVEIPRLRHAAQEVSEMIEMTYRGDGWPKGSGLLVACQGFAMTVEKRRREYAAMVTGGAA